MNDAYILAPREQDKPALPREEIIDRIHRAAVFGPAGLQPIVDGSEDHMALIFGQLFRSKLLFVADWNKWMAWNGRHWAEAKDPVIWNHVRAVVRQLAHEEPGETDHAHRKRNSRATVVNVASLARGDLLAKAERFDADPWELNTPIGIIDLQTGKRRPLDPESFCTKITAIAPDSNDPADRPLWERFLATVTGGNRELQDYLQRFAGYCLTAVTSEHVMQFLYGTGANGKSVFLNTLRGILGTYAITAAVDTFTETKGERHPTDMARLDGARLVTAQETEEGRYWAESKVKALTGGDTISARFMRGDFFEYTPRFKLVVAGNHRPNLHSVDEAFRRRLHMVPFTVTIPAEDRDAELADKLVGEWGAILSWMIEGCMEWQIWGLDPPATVLDTTREYFTAQDPLADWMEAKTVRQPGVFTPHKVLYASWQSWCADNGGSELMGPKQFTQRLEGHGLQAGKASTRSAERGFKGVALK